MKLSTFINQKPYEKIVLEIRRHPITLIPSIILFIIVLLLPPIFLAIDIAVAAIELIWSPLYTLLLSTYYIIAIVFFYVHAMDFYLDVLILTNDRLIDIDQHSLFSRTISEMDLFQVQDVSTEIKGMIPSMFNYGTVHIQNASLQTKFTITQAQNPDKLREMILDLANEDRKFHNSTPSASPIPSPTSEPAPAQKM